MASQLDNEAGVTDSDTATAVVRAMPSGLALSALVMILASAWGGIVAFVGPTFGFGASSAPSWTWNYGHFLVGVLPAGLGVLAGLGLLALLRAATVGAGRFGVSFAGMMAMVAGSWFAIAPQAWSVLYGGQYFHSASALRQLAFEGGYAVGPGMLVAMSGAFALGWALCAHGGARVLAFVPRSPMRHLRSAGEASRVAS